MGVVGFSLMDAGGASILAEPRQKVRGYLGRKFFTNL
jgi:hypothetical protein